MILRVGKLVVATEGGAALPLIRVRASQLVPHFVGQRQIQIGNHDGAVGHFAHCAQQSCQSGRRAGDAGCNHGRFGRRFPPSACSMSEQHVAPGGGVADTALFTLRFPTIKQGSEIAERVLPMDRQVGGQFDHAFVQQVAGVHLLDQQAIDGPRRFPRKAQESGPARRVVHRLADDAGQDEQALGRIDCGRNVGDRQRIEQGTEALVEVQIADDDHPRKKQTCRPRLPTQPGERLAHRPLRSATRQQKGEFRQTEAIIEIARAEPRNQGVRKTAMGGNRVDVRPCGLTHGATRFPRARYVPDDRLLSSAL